jgi:hypothetical protein
MERKPEAELVLYKNNKPYVTKKLKNGEVDYIGLSEWSFADNFFGFLIEQNILSWIEESYPTPREKKEVPIYAMSAAMFQMKLNTTAAFNSLPGILKSGSILTKVGFNIGEKNGGFNNKNKKKRETIISQDAVRKFFKDTVVNKLEYWMNIDFTKILRNKRAIDKAGIFLMDHTYLPLPNNKNYEKAELMPLDEHGNLIDVNRLSEEKRRNLKYTYCYGLTTLLHVNGSGDKKGFIYTGSHVGGGSESGLTVGKKIIDDFIESVGTNVIKLLIVDRGYIDGSMITDFKKNYKIDTLIPVRKNMTILSDAIGMSKLKGDKWEEYSEIKNKSGEVIYKEEVMGFEDVKSWDDCKVPLYVALMKVTEKGKAPIYWALVSTKKFKSAKEAFDKYKIRTEIEERHKQLKLYWNINKFTSTAFSLVASHVYLTLMVYTLVQLYLIKNKLNAVANKTIATLKKDERLGNNAVIIYSGGYYGVYDIVETIELVIDLEPIAKNKLMKLIQYYKKYKYRKI